jgi:hypothetical protein
MPDQKGPSGAKLNSFGVLEKFVGENNANLARDIGTDKVLVEASEQLF